MEFFSPIVIFEYRMDPNNDSFDSEVCFFMQNLLFRNSFKSFWNVLQATPGNGLGTLKLPERC